MFNQKALYTSRDVQCGILLSLICRQYGDKQISMLSTFLLCLYNNDKLLNDLFLSPPSKTTKRLNHNLSLCLFSSHVTNPWLYWRGAMWDINSFVNRFVSEFCWLRWVLYGNKHGHAYAVDVRSHTLDVISSVVPIGSRQFQFRRRKGSNFRLGRVMQRLKTMLGFWDYNII